MKLDKTAMWIWVASFTLGVLYHSG